MKYIVSLGLFVMLAFAGFGQRTTRAEYVERYAAIAIEEMQRTGIPASIKLAQACLESADGNSELARKSNNHFGIKCYSSWKGKRTYHDDDAKNECFRVYETVLESFKDHSEFLKNGQRYAFLFSYDQTDYKNWAHGLKKAGYATNPNYAQMLIKIIEEHELHKYDKPNALVANAEVQEKTPQKVRGAAPNPTLAPPNLMANKAVRQIAGRDVYRNNNVDYVILQDGETLFSLARKLSIPTWKLFSFNDLQKGEKVQAGDIIYIQPKKAKAEKPYISHKVASGETLHSIAQLYAVKVDKLAKLNTVDKNQEIVEGSNVFVGKVVSF
ncbi:MAG: glucosaminidase domain-containing protein [Bacteroidetes bacterium]|nr:glucosaminidase domain-containing protein [Bacteroidota bacterium]